MYKELLQEMVAAYNESHPEETFEYHEYDTFNVANPDFYTFSIGMEVAGDHRIFRHNNTTEPGGYTEEQKEQFRKDLLTEIVLTYLAGEVSQQEADINSDNHLAHSLSNGNY